MPTTCLAQGEEKKKAFWLRGGIHAEGWLRPLSVQVFTFCYIIIHVSRSRGAEAAAAEGRSSMRNPLI